MCVCVYEWVRVRDTEKDRGGRRSESETDEVWREMERVRQEMVD